MGYIGKVNDTAGNTHLVGSTLYGTCSTGASTAAKVVTCPNFTELVEGVTIHVKFTYSNTAANATMNVNSTGAKNLCRYGTTRVGTTTRAAWQAGAIVSFTYDGTSWVQNDYIEDTGLTSVDSYSLGHTTSTLASGGTQHNITFSQGATQLTSFSIKEEDTKITAGSSNSTSKLYLVGAPSQSSSGAQTFSSSKVYETDGALVADSFNGLYLTERTNGFDIATYSGSNLKAGILLSDDGIEIVSNMTDGTPETALGVPDGEIYILGDACEKGVDTSISAGSTSTNLPTTQAVVEYIAGQAAGAATFQGTLVQTDSGSSSTKWTQAELEAASYKSGWYWVVETAGTYAGNVMEVGDMLFCVSDKASAYAASDFAAIQNNIETLTNTEIDNLWANAVAVS